MRPHTVATVAPLSLYYYRNYKGNCLFTVIFSAVSLLQIKIILDKKNHRQQFHFILYLSPPDSPDSTFFFHIYISLHQLKNQLTFSTHIWFHLAPVRISNVNCQMSPSPTFLSHDTLSIFHINISIP
jgi:hypothetical protein